MFCPNCGSQTTGSFCPNCGAQVSGSTAGATGAGYGSVPPAASFGGLTENVASALCYLFGLVTGIIFLVLAPYNQNRTIRFHAFQSIFLNVAWFVCLVLTGLTHVFVVVFAPVVGLLFVLLWLYMMFTAFNNKKIKLPVIGDLAEKQA